MIRRMDDGFIGTAQRGFRITELGCIIVWCYGKLEGIYPFATWKMDWGKKSITRSHSKRKQFLLGTDFFFK